MADLTIDDFLRAGHTAAAAFGLEIDELSLLSHSENVVLALTASDGEKFAMRLHRPGYNTIAEMESEVQFVDSLQRFGVPVPSARPLVSGGHYTPVDVGGVAHHVGVIGWVDGSPVGGPLQAGGPGIVEHYRTIGRLAAQVRGHYAVWNAPTGFTRRRWDADGLVGDAPIWDRFWEVELLTDDQRSLFSRARDRVAAVLEAIPVDESHFGLIHADLHLGNVMANGSELTVIDFDDSGYGYFVHELAVALHPMLGEDEFDASLAALVAGYREVHPLSDDEVGLIEHFLAMRSLMIVGWLAARPEVPVFEHWDDVIADVEAHISSYLAAS